MSVIYKIVNNVNNKYYIGSAVSFLRRVQQHKSALNKGVHKNPRLQAAWNKYGPEAFSFRILELVPLGMAPYEAENTYLKECVGRPDCYNINTDAFTPRLGVKLSEESKQKLRTSRKGKHAGESHYRYGKTVSEEVREKIGATQRGKPKAPGRKLSEEGRAKILASAAAGNYSHWKGRKHTEEAKQKLRKEVKAVDPRGVVHYFESLTTTLGTLGFLMPTLTRALKTNKPLSKGPLAGWVFSYREDNVEAPHIPEEFLPYPRSRQEAKTTGAKFYFTGVPCSRGHVALRLTKGACEICRREDWSKKPLDTHQQPC